MKKKIINVFSIWIVSAIIVFLLFSFSSATLDFTRWSDEARGGCAFAMGFLFMPIIMFTDINKE